MQRCHPPFTRHYTKGFTLIEILVVIVIISISVGLVVVNISTGGPEEKAEQEIIRLQQLLRFAHQQSVIRSQEYGVRFYTTGYRFMQYDEESQQWADIQRDRLLRSRPIPEPLELSLYIDQLSVEIPENTDEDPVIEPVQDNQTTGNVLPVTTPKRVALNVAEADKIKPQIFMLSSAELSPAFEILIRVPGSEIEERLVGLPQGEYNRVLDED